MKFNSKKTKRKGVEVKKTAFTLIKVMIVVAVIALLAAIAIPNLAKQHAHQIAQTTHQTTKGGGEGMFRFIELMLTVSILYIIANLIHYIFVKVTGFGNEGFWLFGLSTSWIKKEEEKKQQAEEKAAQSQEKTTTRRRTSI